MLNLLENDSNDNSNSGKSRRKSSKSRSRSNSHEKKKDDLLEQVLNQERQVIFINNFTY